MPISGAVLAGGASSRMGRPKHALVVDGESLLTRQLRILSEIGISDRLVSWDCISPDPRLPSGVRLVRDEVSGLGPLSGIQQVLKNSTYDNVLILAVDLPLLAPSMLLALISKARPGLGVVPIRNGRFDPLVAIYPRQLLDEATRRLDRTDLALQPFVAEGISQGCLIAWPVPTRFEDCFTNWNSPADQF